MRIIRDAADCPKECRNAVVALGNFDGVHRGHKAILAACVHEARKQGVPAAVMTFEPHPREYFARTPAPLRITSFRQKMALIHEAGIDTVFVLRFNQTLSSLTPQDFVHGILHKALGVNGVVTGYNFAFGKGRGGDTSYLATESQKLGFGFRACRPVADSQGMAVSSSAIRHLLEAGNVAGAEILLGRPYAIEGMVRHGQQRGREMRVPTANIALGKLFRPRFGVYVVRLGLRERFLCDGVANLGVRPTFDGQEPLLEVHGFDLHQDLYGQRLCVEFVDFLRDEKRFDSPEALKQQIIQDCEQARMALARLRPKG
jgi:riboflavin kinase / FMN adenylyltransferase